MSAKKIKKEAIDLTELLDAYSVKDKVRLECNNQAKNQYKFYEIEIKAEPKLPSLFSVKVRYGRIGSIGIESMPFQSFDRKECLSHAEKLFQSKLKKGYVQK